MSLEAYPSHFTLSPFSLTFTVLCVTEIPLHLHKQRLWQDEASAQHLSLPFVLLVDKPWSVLVDAYAEYVVQVAEVA
jgi:hypothetical protein